MIHYTLATTDDELRGILALQSKNLVSLLSAEEISSQGFVTVSHHFEQLKKLNDTENHILAKSNDKVVGYVLSMTASAKNDVPVLYPMFDMFEKTFYQSRLIADYTYMVVGQVCVDKEYRGQGIFDGLYKTYREHHQSTYDFAITEIATNNHRSLNAHKRVGFKELLTYTAPGGKKWVIVIWDWNKV